MASIPHSFVDDIIQRTDITDIIGHRVPLKKKGQTFGCCCPFHDEKTPSFNVNVRKQYYHCFGCGAGGDVIRFLMEYDRLTFVEAVEYLANRLGVDIPKTAQSYTPKINPDVLSVVDNAANYYRQLLGLNQEAKAYVRRRELSDEIIERFLIGYSPAGWDNLIKHSLQSFNTNDNPQACLEWLRKAGLIIKKENQNDYYDRFRNRLMFPIRNTKGKIVGFGGRVIDPEENPKYLNSPETELFHKSQELYGLYEAISQRGSLESIIVVEGYMDVVSLAQFGVHNVVATLGTAIGKSHLMKLFKYCQHVIFCFDGDEAGQRAAVKAMDVCLPEMIDGREASFLLLENNEDPDSLIRDKGQEYFHHAVSKAKKLSTYLLEQSTKALDLTIVEDKVAFIRRAMPLIESLPKTLTKTLLIEEVADRVQWPMEKINELKGSVNNAPVRQANRQQSITPKPSPEYSESVPPPIEDEFYSVGEEDLRDDNPIRIDVDPLLIINQMLRYIFINPDIIKIETIDWSVVAGQQNGYLVGYVKEAITQRFVTDIDIDTFLAYFSGKYSDIINDFMRLYRNLEQQFGFNLSEQEALDGFMQLYETAIIKPMQLARVKEQLESLKDIPLSELTEEDKKTQSILYRQLTELVITN